MAKSTSADVDPRTGRLVSREDYLNRLKSARDKMTWVALTSAAGDDKIGKYGLEAITYAKLAGSVDDAVSIFGCMLVQPFLGIEFKKKAAFEVAGMMYDLARYKDAIKYLNHVMDFEAAQQSKIAVAVTQVKIAICCARIGAIKDARDLLRQAISTLRQGSEYTLELWALRQLAAFSTRRKRLRFIPRLVWLCVASWFENNHEAVMMAFGQGPNSLGWSND